MRKYPVGMVLGGCYYWNTDGSLEYQSSLGFYWSSSAYTSTTSSYDLYLNSYNVTIHPAHSYGKRVGLSLRCLARNQTKNEKSLKPINKRQNNKKEKKCL